MMIAMAKAEYRETGAARHISLDHPLSAADWFVALFISFFKLMWMIMIRMMMIMTTTIMTIERH